MIPITCTMIHNFIRIDTGSLARDHFTGDDDNDGASLEEDADVSDGDGVHVGESSAQANIQHDRDMHQFRDYVADCIHKGNSG